MNKLNRIKLHNRTIALLASSESFNDDNTFFNSLASLLADGVDIVIYGEKNKTAKEIISLANKVKVLCGEFGTLFIIKSRADIAFAVQADGVFLTEDDIDIHTAREILGTNSIIGAMYNSGLCIADVDFVTVDLHDNIPISESILYVIYNDNILKNIDIVLNKGYSGIILNDEILSNRDVGGHIIDIKKNMQLYKTS